MSAIAPGWYDDGHGALRWWDGQQWTEHVQPHPQGMPDPWQRPRTTPAPETSSQSPEATGDTAASDGVPVAQDAPSGIFVAATAPQRSRTWIIWVIVGVAMLVAVVLAAVLIPLAILGFGRVSAPAAVEPTNDDERGAVEAVYQFDEAWQTADCDLFLGVTTERLREIVQIKDCATFAGQSEAFTEWYSDYEIVVTGIRGPGYEYTVATQESYVAHLDQDGNPIEPGVQQVVEYEYTLVPDDDGWAVYDLVSVE
ncbi:MAG: hypothetical protein DSY74_05125 [Actinobacteria bacterium]|jgi:hypothetical protein|uniref:DUF2510 domain-containing protein n=1 Tax=Microbacterium schleiferi TaxID=69362 RepID=UPI000DFABEB5|nr:MAG: DUF2510 domain-containing protein [Microbacterium sp.]RUA26254.1 MAG: hypothetical protein DSY74_05125 [Actinomycetota bacterium]HAM13667.1 hypothetical protein [Microbacterium sp.]HIE61009.1 DUF2510 domain-containing protein [Microbacterium sp.]|tara:strand:- start:7464 stop:8225 length:762 start_codon:yes stop_codon:yes gene_type:complete